MDSTFQPSLLPEEGTVAMAWQEDGKILLGGWLTTGTGSSRIFRHNADGSLDPGFAALDLPIKNLATIQVAQDGHIWVTGVLSINSSSITRVIARLQSDGTVDASFQPQFADGERVLALAPYTDGSVIYSAYLSPNVYVRRLLSNGSADPSFHTCTFSGNVTALLPLPNHKILLGGLFSTINGLSHPSFVAVNED
jgi:uncharacterized delta-60 repeat protein